MIPKRWLFMLMALVAYSLPWAAQPGLALTLNAYDLAEWTSLHPVVHTSSLPLALTFGFRIIPPLLLIIFAVDPSAQQWERVILTAFIAVALLPPLTSFANGFSDPNHRQQLAVSLLALIVGGISLARMPHGWRRPLQITGAIACGTISLGALITGLDLIRGFELAVQPGTGGILLVGVLIAFAINIRGNSSQVTP